jgi:SAM-dependent methyltransferase
LRRGNRVGAGRFRKRGLSPFRLWGVRAFYEAFWADAPRDPEPWAFAERRALLVGEVEPGERVLDLGCGAGRFLAVVREAGAEAVGVELAEAAAERARENVPGADVRLVGADGSLPLGHGEVDLVWCSEVLEHVPDVADLLLEVRRVLRRGGRLLLTVPFHGRLQAAAIALTRFDAHFDPLGQHVRFFTARSLAQTLDAAGYAPVAVRARGGVPGVRRLLTARAVRP